ncbi:uracil-DNA glycosylase family protein [Peribacillus glennii]|uniref:Uracil-DNA glycosylase-like domain-containing protein n=1 Tax=Peribacillus glennii TaxID=2303991 RepID=A0A372LF51_9BACI|nr:hypothetical protein [Peribacillus glennii]RFU64953.1 hypothetical protein D0466_03295 [Peribacillus glennii]
MSYREPLFKQYYKAIEQLPQQAEFTKKDLLTAQFLLEKQEDLEMYYSPHNEFINHEAKIAIVGITPGWTQMKKAFEHAAQSLRQGFSSSDVLRSVKQAASFSGTMRTNLISMLDRCGVPQAIGSCGSESLFSDKCDLLHTTSIIKYPVFYQNKNYTGHRPKIDQSPLLTHYGFEVFPKEMEKLKSCALVIPLGKTVEQVFTALIREEKLPLHHYLFGFPHPSGANGHRKKQFDAKVLSFQMIVQQWAKNFNSIN